MNNKMLCNFVGTYEERKGVHFEISQYMGEYENEVVLFDGLGEDLSRVWDGFAYCEVMSWDGDSYENEAGEEVQFISILLDSYIVPFEVRFWDNSEGVNYKGEKLKKCDALTYGLLADINNVDLEHEMYNHLGALCWCDGYKYIDCKPMSETKACRFWKAFEIVKCMYENAGVNFYKWYYHNAMSYATRYALQYMTLKEIKEEVNKDLAF